MAFHPGDSTTVLVTANGGDLAADPQVTMVSSDTSVATVSATADPFAWRLDFLAAGSTELSSTAINSDGNMISGFTSTSATNPAATSLTLTVVEL